MYVNNTASLAEFGSVKLGRCGGGALPGASTRKMVREMLSASDAELEKLLVANESKFEERSKLCAEEVLTANRVKGPAEWAPLGSLANYLLFEWSGQQRSESGVSQPSSHFYLRGKLQRVAYPPGRTHHNRLLEALFKIPEIRDVWLIATNRRVNFSVQQTEKETANSVDSDADKKCKDGINVHLYLQKHFSNA